MANEPEEVIKHQMLETRASLTEKLETLEQQVVGTVQNATSAVTDTVTTVKDAVQQTVAMAKNSVQDTMEAVKDTFDLPRQVQEHPWLMMGGSVAVGYVGGYLLSRLEPAASHRGMPGASSLSTLAAQTGPDRNGGVRSRPEETAASPTAASTGHGLLGEVGERFGSELTKLKGLALATILGVVRDMVTSSAPPQVSAQLADIIDNATVKLGGQPIRGPVLSMFQHDASGPSEAGYQRGRGTEESPRGATRQYPPGAAAGTVD